MSFDKADAFKGFLIGVLSSVTAVILWDFYKQKKNNLAPKIGPKHVHTLCKMIILGFGFSRYAYYVSINLNNIITGRIRHSYDKTTKTI